MFVHHWHRCGLCAYESHHRRRHRRCWLTTSPSTRAHWHTYRTIHNGSVIIHIDAFIMPCRQLCDGTKTDGARHGKHNKFSLLESCSFGRTHGHGNFNPFYISHSAILPATPQPPPPWPGCPIHPFLLAPRCIYNACVKAFNVFHYPIQDNIYMHCRLRHSGALFTGCADMDLENLLPCFRSLLAMVLGRTKLRDDYNCKTYFYVTPSTL